jgi:NAD(P)H dehydrogenase (quinone)
VVQHGNVLAAAETAGVTFLVYTSATKATTSALVLAPEHKATEELLGGSHLAHAIVRNNWYTENYAVQLETARQTGTVVAAVGEGRVASASRADYAAGAVAALLGEGHAGRVYELSGDVAWDYEELAGTIGRVLGRPVSYRSVDADTLVAELTAAGVDQASAGFVAALDANIADGLLAQTSGDLAALIGRPTTPLYDGLLLA